MIFVGRRISMQLQAGRQATAERPVDVTAERGVAGGIEVVSCDNLCFLNTGDCGLADWGSWAGRSRTVGRHQEREREKQSKQQCEWDRMG